MKKSFLVPALFISLLVGLTNCKKDNPNNGGNQPVTPVTPVPPVVTGSSDVAMWLTNADQSQLFNKQTTSLNFTTASNTNTTISVDTTQTYQSIDGFGFCLTGGSATLLNSLSATSKEQILKELFSTDNNNIGVSYLRISIGASDMSASDFTYDDVNPGLTDVSLANFSIDKEKTDLIPILQKILALNPNIKILACPWTAPVWMKQNAISNSGFTGGSLDPAYYDAYAKYFVKYIQAMKAQGITIDAVTPQNEPLYGGNNPSMQMQATEEANFIKNNLGPQFKAANITTKIICYDHNADRPDYPEAVLADPGANPFVDGSAFHLYGGDISALTGVYNAYPTKNIYFTEQYTPSTGTFSGDLSWAINNLIVGATRNWSRNVLEWNLAIDPNLGPHTNGGCNVCLGALTIGTSVSRNQSYYIIAHASKFVRPGSVRIASTQFTALPNVAFKTPDGKKVLIVLNNSGAGTDFNIKFNGKITTSTLNNGSVATYVW